MTNNKANFPVDFYYIIYSCIFLPYSIGIVNHPQILLIVRQQHFSLNF